MFGVVLHARCQPVEPGRTRSLPYRQGPNLHANDLGQRETTRENPYSQ